MMDNDPTEDHGLVGQLEPAASPYGTQAPLISIGISLKRIADALTNPNQYENPITQAILNGISQGAQDWLGHMVRNGR
jgi:hypothetical protein